MVNDEHLPQRQPDGVPHGMPPSASGAPSLIARIQAAVERDAAKLPQPFDARNVLHVEAAARVLLRRFYERNDSRCFDLLVELTELPLAAMAHDVVREIGLPVAPEVLHGAMLGALFIDTRPEQVDVRQFLSFARRKLEQVARARVAWLARRPIPHLERLPSGLPAPRAPYPGAPFDSDPPEDPVAIDAIVQSSGMSAVAAPVDFDRLGFDFSWLVETLFHRLDEETRVLLRAAEIERKPPQQIAEWREMDVAVATERLTAARAALAASIEDTCARLATKARKSGCTLAGRRPENITAEVVARHLVSCDACLRALDVPPQTAQEAQGQVLAALGGRRPGGAASASALERLLSDARARGREEVARFLYELARACLLQDDAIAQAAWIVETRPPDFLRAGLSTATTRLPGDHTGAQIEGSLSGIDAARRVLSALIIEDGDSSRTLLLSAFLEARQDRWDRVRESLEKVLLREDSEEKWVVWARRNLLRAYYMSGADELVLSHGESLLQDGLAARQVHFCACLVHARRGDWPSFETSAVAFRASPFDEIGADVWAHHVGLHVDEIALLLGRSREQIEATFDLSGLRRQ